MNDSKFVKTKHWLFDFDGTLEYFQKIGLKISIEEMGQEIRSELTPKYVNFILDKPGVRHCLERMKSAGYKLHVLTASPHTSLDPCLKRLGMYDLFGNVWSCDDFGTTKADPEIYRMAAARMGREVGEVIFLDDNLGADKTAKSAGMKVYGVYDPSSAEYADEMKAICDRYIIDFKELI